MNVFCSGVQILRRTVMSVIFRKEETGMRQRKHSRSIIESLLPNRNIKREYCTVC